MAFGWGAGSGESMGRAGQEWTELLGITELYKFQNVSTAPVTHLVHPHEGQKTPEHYKVSDIPGTPQTDSGPQSYPLLPASVWPAPAPCLSGECG